MAQLEAQVGNDQYQLVTSESSLRNYKLQLKQMLELDGNMEMELELPVLDDEKVMQLLPIKTRFTKRHWPTVRKYKAAS